MANQELKNKWTLLFQEFNKIKTSKTAFCKKKSLNMNQFIYWEKKLMKSRVNSEPQIPKSSFIKVNAISKKSKLQDIVIMINDINIIIPSVFNSDTLTKIISVVKSID